MVFKRPKLHGEGFSINLLMFPRVRQIPWYVAHSGVPKYNLGDSFICYLPRQIRVSWANLIGVNAYLFGPWYNYGGRLGARLFITCS